MQYEVLGVMSMNVTSQKEKVLALLTITRRCAKEQSNLSARCLVVTLANFVQVESKPLCVLIV